MNWGILSTADIAIRMFMPAIQQAAGAELKAIASRDFSKAKQIAETFQIEACDDYEALLRREDIDIVYIPLPNSLHYEWAMKALDLGKHVFLEKPATSSYEEAKQLVEKSREKGKALIENFHFHFHVQHEFIKKQLERGVIGEVRCFRSSFGVPPFSDINNIRYKKDLGGGALMDVGVYVVNVCSFLFGPNFEVNGAFLQHNELHDIDWYGGALLSLSEKGILAELAFGFDNYYQNNYEIWGAKGKLIVHRAFTPKPNYLPKITLEINGKGVEHLEMPADNQYQKAIEHVMNLIKTNKIEEERAKIIEQARLIAAIRRKTKTNKI